MNTNHQRSAKIYQFPAGGRAGLGGRRPDEPHSVNDPAASRASEASFGAGWYHDAAIQAALQETKPSRDH